MDQDDSMISSPSSQGDETYDDDNLFPESNTDMSNVAGPQTPQNDHLNAAAPGELSPPRSQSIDIGEDVRSRIPQQIDDTEDLSPAAANRTVMSNAEEEWKPGQGWKSKKVQEDMQRAWDNVVDKDFTLKDFGDVMAHRMSK